MGLLEFFGKNPSGMRQKKISTSPNYDLSQRKFVNKRENELEEMKKNISIFKIVKILLKRNVDRRPGHVLPTANHLEKLIHSQGEISYIWLGHSTVLLKLSGKYILFDPVFQSAAPFSFIKKRFQPSPIPLEGIPKVDFVVLSHDHYDHLEMSTIKFLQKTHTPHFISPLGIGEHLSLWGVPEKNITEMDWWESIEIEGIKIVSTPAMHSSGRILFAQNKTLWCSWVLQTEKSKVFFSGDSGYDNHFKEIGEKHGPFDVTFIECGQYNKMWYLSHMDPSESIAAHIDLKGKKMQPIHWGAFDLSLHSWCEPIRIAFEVAKKKKVELLHPKQGEVVEVSKNMTFENWWE